MAQLTDILVRAMLPLHPRLAASPRLLIQLLSHGTVLGETQAATRDRSGVWEASSTLKLPDGDQLLTLAVVIGKQNNQTRLTSPTFRAQVDAGPDERHGFVAHSSFTQIRVTISCYFKATSSIFEIPSLQPFPARRCPPTLTEHELQSSPEESPASAREMLAQTLAIWRCMPNSNKKVTILGEIGHYYYRLYQEYQDATDLDNSISIQREVTQLGNFHPHQAQYLEDFSVSLEDRYNHRMNRADIDEAIQASRCALSLMRRGAPERVGCLMELAQSSREDLEGPIALSILSSAYHTLYQQYGDPSYLDEAISIQREAVNLGRSHLPQGQPLRYLSRALEDRYDYSGNRADIDEAIETSQNALILMQRDAEEKVALLIQLASNYSSRFKRLGDVADIDMAISTYSEGVALMPEGSLNKVRARSNFAGALTKRFECLGALEDLDGAISNLESVVNFVPDEHPDKPSLYINLGKTLRDRFKRLGSLIDLEMAISNSESAVRLTPNGHPDKPSFYNDLGNVLECRFEHLGDLADLDRATSNKENAVMLTPDGHPAKRLLYSNLGSTLQFRFSRLGTLTDLEMAISNSESAVRLTPNGHPDKPSFYNNLGISLLSRFERLDNLVDLNDAISHQEKALSLTPDSHPDKPLFYINAGNALLSRFERLDDLVDLNDAISHQKNAVALTPDGHAGQSASYDSLATSLTPDGHAGQSASYDSLATSLQIRFEHLGDLVDLNDAIFNQENAVRLLHDSHPHKVGMTCDLARSYESRFKLSASRSDLDLALSLYTIAAQSPVGYPKARLQAAMAWSRCAKLMKTSPLSAYKCAIEQLTRIAWLGISVSEQHSLLEEIGGAVRGAVAAAIDAEEYEMAVEWMEQGRSIVWQNLSKLRAPVDALRAKHPELADKLHSISRQLDSPDSRELKPQTLQDMQRPEVTKSHTGLAIEWDETLDLIRKLPNFESFLKPKNFESLASAAQEGPVVTLNVAEDRCDALALISCGDMGTSVVSIPLTSFSLKLSERLLLLLTVSLQQVGIRNGETRKPTQQPRKKDTRKGFNLLLHVLWLAVVKPVLDGLAYQPRESDLPRIWWCATGPLAFLPIHAAGDYDTTELGQKLSDYAVSSYTPTLTAIIDSSYPIPSSDFKLLTVAQPSAPGYSTIPKTMEEVEQIVKVANSVSVVNLTKEAATVERVQKAMRECHWVHLACHGKQDTSKPIESGLILYDGTLRLSTIIKKSLSNADFAFLSACQTAMGDRRVEEESVHLAAGMLLAGYRGVIATMWSIKDDDGPQVAEVVYGWMMKDGKPNRREAAYALHEAVKQLRESGAELTSWVPFIHIGR